MITTFTCGPALESMPPQYECKITYSDGRKVTVTLDGDEVAERIRGLALQVINQS